MVSTSQRPHQYTYDPDGFITKVKGFHRANFDAVSNSLRHKNQQLRKSIATDSDSQLTDTRLYSMLLSVWCEARLHVLVYEAGAFDECQRAEIYNSGSVEEKWKKSLLVAVRKKSGNVGQEITDENTDFSLFNIFTKVNSLIDQYFVPVIRNRNKIAHSQWITPFTNLEGEWINSSSFKVCETSKTDFEKDNLLTLERKIELLKTIAVAINNIAVDSSNFQAQSFDEIYKNIQTEESKLKSVDFESFKQSVQSAYQRSNT